MDAAAAKGEPYSCSPQDLASLSNRLQLIANDLAELDARAAMEPEFEEISATPWHPRRF